MVTEGLFNFQKYKTIITYLSLRIVQSSPPRQASKSMYKYLLFLNVVYNLKINYKETLWEDVNHCSRHFSPRLVAQNWRENGEIRRTFGWFRHIRKCSCTLLIGWKESAPCEMAFIHVALNVCLGCALWYSLKLFNNEQEHITLVGIGYTLFHELDCKESLRRFVLGNWTRPIYVWGSFPH